MLLKQLILITTAALVDVASSQSIQVCPVSCTEWFDGCNRCTCEGVGVLGGCTEKSCDRYENPMCSKYNEVCPVGCAKWFDGCNHCTCEGVGVLGGCTKKSCDEYKKPMCSNYDEVCPVGCTKWFDGCNHCTCEGVGVLGGCTRKFCERYEKPMCSSSNYIEEYITFPQLGLGEVVEINKRHEEDFKVKLTNKGMKEPEWLTTRPPDKPINKLGKFACKKKQAKDMKCDTDEECIRIKVPSGNGEDDDDDNEESKKPKWTYKPFCLRPCARVCTGISLRCGALADDPPKYPIWWYNFENRRCFQVEQVQGSKKKFIRTTCKCPTRDYTISDSCTINAGASLSNCVQAYISQAPEINFQDLSNVQLGYVKSTGNDIDFQGKVKRSLFCRIDAHEDVEFGGGSCAAHLENNVFFNTVMNKDYQFEEGAVLKQNILFDVKIGDDFEVKDEAGGAWDTLIQDNLFGDISVDDDCKIHPSASAGVTISGNYCNTFTHSGSGSGCGTPPFDSGFSCL